MSRIRSKDTKPEMRVRRLVHGLGYRYRLHANDLPGRPDLVFRKRRKVILVHGCYWHLHEPCTHYRLPTARREFWMPKLESNRRRDADNEQALRAMGWDVLILWECELRDTATLTRRIREFLD